MIVLSFCLSIKLLAAPAQYNVRFIFPVNLYAMIAVGP